MSSRPLVQEQLLSVFATCPLMTVPLGGNPILNCSMQVWRWLLLLELDHMRPELKKVRERFVILWDRRWQAQHGPAIPNTGPYWNGPKQAAVIARKLHDSVARFTVLVPERDYKWELDGRIIAGRYAIVKPHYKRTLPMVVTLYPDNPRSAQSRLPDIVSLARYCHAREHYPEMGELGILHIPLNHGRNWIDRQVNWRMAHDWIRDILDGLYGSQLRYPNVGSHCRSCVERDCGLVFRHTGIE